METQKTARSVFCDGDWFFVKLLGNCISDTKWLWALDFCPIWTDSSNH